MQERQTRLQMLGPNDIQDRSFLHDKQMMTLRPYERLKLSFRVPQIRFRTLEPNDREELLNLHDECFPIKYESHFFEKAMDGRLFSCCAVATGG